MATRTICCKLSTSPEAKQALKETSEQFAKACNHTLKVAESEKTSNALKLHHACYADLRKLYGLSANLAIRALRRAAVALTKLKGKRKRPKRFEPKSIDYDARIFTFFEEEERITLTTTSGRISLPLLLGKDQRNALKGKKPTSATVINKGGTWYIHVVIECEVAKANGSHIIGVDLGINNIAAVSTGLCIEGQTRKEFKKKRAKVRASLQSKGTKGAKRVLQKLSGYENRRIRHENHVLSKQLVEEAIRHDCGTIRMEQLKAIRDKTKTWNKHLNRMVAGWSFYQLQNFVNYKAAACGITTEFVNPAYTSQTCHRCLKIGSRSGERFTCLTCGEEHADVNASRVIALGGAACKPARISSPIG